MRKTAIFIVSVITLTAVVFYFVPIKRSADYTLLVQAPQAIVRQKLLTDSLWKQWYFNETQKPQSALTLESNRGGMAIQYTLYNGSNRTASGIVAMKESFDGGTFLKWHEETRFSSGLFSKLSLLLHPGAYASEFQNSILTLKKELERPPEEEGGFRYKMYKARGHAIAALEDTVLFSGAEQDMLALYKNIKSRFAPSLLHDTTRFISRYTYIEGDLVQLQVGLRLKDATTKIPLPLKRLEVPSILILATAAKAGYAQVGQVMQAADVWAKKYNLKLATQPWIEHKVKSSNGQHLLADTLRIIQPFYYWPYPIEETY
jgi:hypothetical protein